MKTTFLTLFSLTIGLLSSFGQTLNKEYIDKWVLNTFPNSYIDDKVVYVLNGLPIASDTINIVLVKYQRTDLTTILYLDKNEIQNINFCGQSTGMILLCTKGNQSKESIVKELNRVKELYKKPDLRTTADIDVDKKEPVLVIDGNQIFFRDNYDTLQKIKANKIIGINYIKKPVSVEFYGTNAKNGLIIITTNKKSNR